MKTFLKPDWTALRQEPYRLLFPLGLAFGAIGMGIWIPFYFDPQSFPYPGQGHAAIQLQGFMLCFILGFLGTMLPKVLGVPPMGPWQFAFLPIGIAALVFSALMDAPLAGQILHLLVLGNFLLFIARRWKLRVGTPPPPFAFIGMAMAAEILGTCLRIHALLGHVGPSALRAASLLQYQAFPLLLILGVGSFLLPRLFTNAVLNPQVLRGMPGAGIPPTVLAMGGLFLASFAVEAWGGAWLEGSLAVRSAYILRAGVWGFFLFARLRLHRVPMPQPAYLEGARLSLYSIWIGMLLPILWPAQLLAWEHVVFIGGLLWLTLSIASRVVAAHGGRLDLLARFGRRTAAYGFLVVLAAGTRVFADFGADTRWLHLAAAGAVGIAVLGVWAWNYLPLFFRSPGGRG